jgi:hypothetical protein
VVKIRHLSPLQSIDCPGSVPISKRTKCQIRRDLCRRLRAHLRHSDGLIDVSEAEDDPLRGFGWIPDLRVYPGYRPHPGDKVVVPGRMPFIEMSKPSLRKFRCREARPVWSVIEMKRGVYPTSPMTVQEPPSRDEGNVRDFVDNPRT